MIPRKNQPQAGLVFPGVLSKTEEMESPFEIVKIIIELMEDHVNVKTSKSISAINSI